MHFEYKWVYETLVKWVDGKLRHQGMPDILQATVQWSVELTPRQ